MKIKLDTATIAALINADLLVEQQFVAWIESLKGKTDDQEFDEAKQLDADTHERVKALLATLPE